jgi:hypothetical protein
MIPTRNSQCARFALHPAGRDVHYHSIPSQCAENCDWIHRLLTFVQHQTISFHQSFSSDMRMPFGELWTNPATYGWHSVVGEFKYFSYRPKRLANTQEKISRDSISRKNSRSHACKFLRFKRMETPGPKSHCLKLTSDRVSHEFMSISPWNHSPTFAIEGSDITQGVEPSPVVKKFEQQILERKRCKHGEKYQHISDRRISQMEQRSLVFFLRLNGLSKKPSTTSLLRCSRRMPSRTRV